MQVIPIAVLAAVFLLIAIRQVGSVKLHIWQIMLGGAAAVILTGQISPLAAASSVNLDVILFLSCMFVIGSALEESGFLGNLAFYAFQDADSKEKLLFLVIFLSGIASAFLMNDTLAVIGTPLVLLFARRQGIDSKILLLALAFAITIGSVASPIGNPQNLLIALSARRMTNPFFSFFSKLLIPTLICLLVEFVLIRFVFYRKSFGKGRLVQVQDRVRDQDLAGLCKVSLILLLFGISAKILLLVVAPSFDFRITLIAIAAAAPIILFSERRLELVKKSDWKTLAFFASMFVLMQSVWDSGFFQSILSSTGADPASLPVIFVSGIFVSQFISNVPLVALYLPLIAGAGERAFLALAASSTLAGSLTILGAASNVIILQSSEDKEKGTDVTFLEFLRIGAPLTAICALVYWAFLSIG